MCCDGPGLPPRPFFRDNGQTRTGIRHTNFPAVAGKFFVHRSSRGYDVMVSDWNPRSRDLLTPAAGDDGLVVTRLIRLVGGRHVDDPHIIEHDGHLLIVFAGVL